MKAAGIALLLAAGGLPHILRLAMLERPVHALRLGPSVAACNALQHQSAHIQAKIDAVHQSQIASDHAPLNACNVELPTPLKAFWDR